MDKEALFALRLPEQDIEIPGVGTIRVRGLSRHEAIVMQAEKTQQEQERRMLSFAVLDPALTVDDVKRWQACSPAAEIEPVTTLITKLSGMAPDSGKEAYKSV